MIRNIEIKNLRGFRHFRLEGLTGLTILTGRNGCGKSTLLDALLMGASPDCALAVGLTVKRHPMSKDGARWLFNRTEEPIQIGIESDSGETWTRRLDFSGSTDETVSGRAQKLKLAGHSHPFRRVSTSALAKITTKTNLTLGVTTKRLGDTVISLDGAFLSDEIDSEQSAPVPDCRLIDPALFQDLTRSFTKAVQQGQRSRIQDFLRAVIPDLVSIQILTEEDDSANVYLEWPFGAVPLSFSGDGIAAMLQIAIEAVLVETGGLVLIEEPEVFLHPRGISVVAGLLLELMRQGRQVVITTHSLELIDSLLGRSEDADLDRMSLFNLRPADGAPTVVAWPGRQFDYFREKIGDDLR